jgi:hypothetical protein
MLEKGVRVGIGVDGSASNDSSNFLREIQMALLVHRVGTAVDAMPAQRVLRMATVGGAEVLGRPEVGRIAPGWRPTWRSSTWSASNLRAPWRTRRRRRCSAAAASAAEYTIVAGRVVVENGRLVGEDEARLFHRANEIAARMLRRRRRRRDGTTRRSDAKDADGPVARRGWSEDGLMRMFKDFVVPGSLDEARAELKRLGAEGVPLAGASSLLFLRHKEPKVAVDLSRAGLGGICADGDGFVIGAMTTIDELREYQAEGWVLDRVAGRFCHPADAQSCPPWAATSCACLRGRISRWRCWRWAPP